MSNSDISPSLLRAIIKDFKRYCNANDKLLAIIKKIKKGTATHSDTHNYAVEIGKCLSKAYKNNLSSQTLPDGKMYWNIAKSVIEPTLTNNYNMINNVAMSVQEILNKEAGIGLKSMKTTFNMDRVNGFMNKMANAEQFDDVSYLLDEPVVNFTQSVVDDFIKENANLHHKAGLNSVIIRTAQSKCCKWCSKLAGTYDYEQVSNKGNDVFRRHENCRCLVVFKDDKDVQNVHTKRELTGEEVERLNSLNPTFNNDITPQFFGTSTPQKGSITYDKNYKKAIHKNEIEMSEFIFRTFGGNMILLNESQVQSVKTADFLWNKKLWELKTLSTEKSADSAIRKGLKQIQGNPGGIILDYRGKKVNLQKLLKIIDSRMQRSKEGNADIMIVLAKNMIKVFRY